MPSFISSREKKSHQIALLEDLKMLNMGASNVKCSLFVTLFSADDDLNVIKHRVIWPVPPLFIILW